MSDHLEFFVSIDNTYRNERKFNNEDHLKLEADHKKNIMCCFFLCSFMKPHFHSNCFKKCSEMKYKILDDPLKQNENISSD